MIAFPPVASIVAIAIIIFTTGYTILVAVNALLPTKRDTNIPSMIVYNDINIIIMMDGAANRNNFKGVNSWFKDILIKTPAFSNLHTFL